MMSKDKMVTTNGMMKRRVILESSSSESEVDDDSIELAPNKATLMNAKLRLRDDASSQKGFLSDSDSSFEKHLKSLQIKDETNMPFDEAPSAKEGEVSIGKGDTSYEEESFSDSFADSESEVDSEFSFGSKRIKFKTREISTSKKTENNKATQDDLSIGNESISNESYPDSSDEKQTKNDDDMGKIGARSLWKFDKDRKEYFLAPDSMPKIRWPKCKLPQSIFNKLFDYQVEGVQFLASLHENGIGGVLGDDMGMGKTFMTVSFLAGLLRANTIRNALIVAPVSVLRSWKAEAEKVFSKCVSNIRIQIVSSNLNRHMRAEIIRKALYCNKQRPFLVITSYSMIRELTVEFAGNDKSYWDYVVLDEGHTIRNHKSQISNSCRAVCRNPKTHRLLLSGTPIMNNLRELWAIFDWATSGKVLGTSTYFNSYFTKTIEGARDKNAATDLVISANRVNKELQNLLKPYFLQRSKADYLSDKLSDKTEVVIWTHLSSQQRNLYQNFVSEDSLVKMILRGEKASPLEAITWLKKLCGHPLIANKHEDIKEIVRNEGIDEVVKSSVKLQLLVGIIEKLRRDGHRTLIFSQSTRMLDIIQIVLTRRCKINLARIDGSTKEIDRQQLVDSFNRETSSLHALLLSTKAAGVGLTLTGADRVIVYDPSWTPAEDSQAVDRCFRIGQTKPVVVFRMISAGTVEEKMYEKQIFKDGIRRTVYSEGATVQRYFSSNELRQLFKLADPGVCDIMEKVQDLKTDWCKFSFLLDHHGVVGLSRHDGFYHPTERREEIPQFDPESQTLVVGKSKRVLQTVDNDTIPLGRTHTDKETEKKDITKLPIKDVPNLRDKHFGPAIQPYLHQSDPCKENKNQYLDVRNAIHDKNFDIEKALEESMRLPPKRSLKLLLDLLNPSCEMNEQQKLQVHQQIAIVSTSLNLLK